MQKVQIIPDKGRKVRAICLADWLTQLVVSPMADLLIQLLNRLPQDCRKDQSKGVKIIRECYNKGLEVQSVDSKDITDRLPLNVQLIVIYKILVYVGISIDTSLDVVRALSVVLGSNRKLSTDIFGYITYRVGQPMGNLLSFPLATLTHHIMVILSAHLAFKDLKSKGLCDLDLELYNIDSYALLGDDLVVGDKPTALQYLKVSKALGMEISLAKSIGMEALSSPGSSHLSEFAKRLTLKYLDTCMDITPLSPTVLSQSLPKAIVDLVRKDDTTLKNLVATWSCSRPLVRDERIFSVFSRIMSYLSLIIMLPTTLVTQGAHSVALDLTNVPKDIEKAFANLIHKLRNESFLKKKEYYRKIIEVVKWPKRGRFVVNGVYPIQNLHLDRDELVKVYQQINYNDKHKTLPMI